LLDLTLTLLVKPVIVKNKRAIYRCYNCHQFGHIANGCRNIRRCINCAGYDCRGFCIRPTCCTNCQGAHRASSTACPVFLRQNENFASRCKKPNYNKRFTPVDGSDTSGKVVDSAGESSSKKGLQMRDFHPPVVKQRTNREGGGVAIFAHKSAKMVELKQFEHDGLEAVWVELQVDRVKCVVASVYIPPGEIQKVQVFSERMYVQSMSNIRGCIGSYGFQCQT